MSTSSFSGVNELLSGTMPANVAVSLVAFLAVICVVASGNVYHAASSPSMREFYLASRKLSVGAGVCSLVATLTSSGMINSTSESMRTEGAIWAVGPLAWGISIWLGAKLLAFRMREDKCMTVLDPLQARLGPRLGALHVPIYLVANVLWVAAILDAVGDTAATVFEQDRFVCMVVAVATALTYTLVGGMRTVVGTDVVQVIIMGVGLVAVVPYALSSPAARPFTRAEGFPFLAGWRATVAAVPVEGSHVAQRLSLGAPPSPRMPPPRAAPAEANLFGLWLDRVVLTLAAQPVEQVYMQRMLAARDLASARRMAAWATAWFLALGAVCYLIGAAGAQTDWAALGPSAAEVCADAAQTTGCVLRYLAPPPLAYLGLLAVVVAMMSSIDSAVLACATLVVWNGLWVGANWRKAAQSPHGRGLLARHQREGAAHRDAVAHRLGAYLRAANRLTMLVIGGGGLAIATQKASVTRLHYLKVDLPLLLLFAPIVSVVNCEGVQAYGVVASAVVCTALRLLSGEPAVHLAAVVRWPGYQPSLRLERVGAVRRVVAVLHAVPGEGLQTFPFRLALCVLAFATIFSVSFLTNYLLFKGHVPRSWDVFGVQDLAGPRAWAERWVLPRTGTAAPAAAADRETSRFFDARQSPERGHSSSGPDIAEDHSSWVRGLIPLDAIDSGAGDDRSGLVIVRAIPTSLEVGEEEEPEPWATRGQSSPSDGRRYVGMV